jgi:hypothetical protein
MGRAREAYSEAQVAIMHNVRITPNKSWQIHFRYFCPGATSARIGGSG